MISTEPGSRFRLAAASAAIGFLAGALVVAIAGVAWERRQSAPEPDSPAAAVAVEGAPLMEIRPAEPLTPPPVMPPPPPDSDALPELASDPVGDLRARNLEMPVLGSSREALRNTFDDARGGSRRHEAIDILAPRGTPVVAVEDGTIAKLFLSDAGGITAYQFDPTTSYVYYYAHLDRYAAGLAEAARVTRGQVLGYVGASGNAPKDTPHLHFAIFKLTESRQWWQGTAIDPFTVLK